MVVIRSFSVNNVLPFILYFFPVIFILNFFLLICITSLFSLLLFLFCCIKIMALGVHHKPVCVLCVALGKPPSPEGRLWMGPVTPLAEGQGPVSPLSQRDRHRAPQARPSPGPLG